MDWLGLDPSQGYQQGPEFFGPSPEWLGHDPHYNPGQLNFSQTGPWPPLVSLHSMLSIAVYTSMYYVLTYFAGFFGRYNFHTKVFLWLMTIYPIIITLTGFQFANLLPYLLQVVPTVLGYYTCQVALIAFYLATAKQQWCRSQALGIKWPQ
ncbi:hypothetical protein DSO57_1011478 [Entomophthora muscae]|uniref:Uncharacterized protein n=1 Tax=Entomophthora muscae TaxID=34485 RepID=A0ACC2RXB6_9FUNG|nr:hypothetical protein DSO57_1011478 [Entomophthora muscae]